MIQTALARNGLSEETDEAICMIPSRYRRTQAELSGLLLQLVQALRHSYLQPRRTARGEIRRGTSPLHLPLRCSRSSVAQETCGAPEFPLVSIRSGALGRTGSVSRARFLGASAGRLS